MVSAFDAGNLEPVAKALREKFPDKILLIAGDDDRAEPGKNPGKEFAAKAARAVGAEFILPTFATGEQSSDPRRFSDFCDVKVNSRLGLAGLREQIGLAVDRVLGEPEQAQTLAPERKAPVQAKARARRDEVTR